MAREHMRLCQLDRILRLEPGRCITAIKTLRASEEYLVDHFPLFPVMPGVLMLEAMFQASLWLVLKSDSFEHCGVYLKEAKNVNYKDFVSPGQTLVVTAEVTEQGDNVVHLKAFATVNDAEAVRARLVVAKTHLHDHYHANMSQVGYSRRELMQIFDEIYHPEQTCQIEQGCQTEQICQTEQGYPTEKLGS